MDKALNIRKVENGLGVMFPPDVVESLRLEEGTELDIHIESSDSRRVQIVLTPPNEALAADSDVSAAAEKIMERYSKALSQLAK